MQIAAAPKKGEKNVKNVMWGRRKPRGEGISQMLVRFCTQVPPMCSAYALSPLSYFHLYVGCAPSPTLFLLQILHDSLPFLFSLMRVRSFLYTKKETFFFFFLKLFVVVVVISTPRKEKR